MTDEPEKVVLRRWALHYYFFVNGNLDDRVVRTLNAELSYFVKDYERTDAFKKGIWNGQNTLFYKTKKGVFYFPAGLLPQVTSVLKAYNVPHTIEALDITNHLTKYPDLGLKWYGPRLRDYQVKCVSDIMLRGGGVLSLPTGGGKTLIALKMIQMYDKPCLIVVHRRELMRQWIKEIKENLHYKAARYAGSEKDRFEYITVGLMQSLIKYKGSLDFPLLVADECLPYESRVITDRGVIPIGDIVEKKIECRVLTHRGRFRRIVGYQKIPRIKTMVRVNHDFGSLICTEDHNILTEHGFVEARMLNKGDVIYHVQMQNLPERIQNIAKSRRSREFKSLSSESECMEGQNKTYRLPETDDLGKLNGGYVHTSRSRDNAPTILGDNPWFEPTRICNVEVLSSKEHIYKHAENKNVPIFQRVCGIYNIPTRMLISNIQYGLFKQREEGNIKGVAEGNRTSGSIGDVVYGRRVCLVQEPIATDSYIYNGVSENRHECNKRLVENGVGNKIDNKCGSERSILLHQYSCEGRCVTNDKLGKTHGRKNTMYEIQDCVYDITVEDDHTFVADGIAVKNCHHVPSATLYSISMNCNAAVRFGLSATPRREQGDELRIWAAMGTIASDIKPTDLIEAGYLARPKFVFLRPPAVNISRKAKWNDLYMDGIVTNQERNAMIIDAANEMLDDGLLTYIHVERIDHGEYLAEHIPGASFVCGATPKKMRDNLIDTFASGQRRCLVSTLLGEGFNAPGLEAIILAGGLKSTTAVIQKIGRALRVKEGKDSAIVVDFVDRGPILGRHWERRYDAFREYYGKFVPDFAIGKGKQTVKKSTVLPGTTSGEVQLT